MNKNINELLYLILNEGLFDDDIILQNDNIEDNINNNTDRENIYEVLEKILCVRNEYSFVITDAEDEGFPPVLAKDGFIYVAPFRTYTTCKLGPRKRKGYPISYFYKYIIKLNDDNETFTLYMNPISSKAFIINEPLYNLIAFLPITKIIYKNSNSLSFDDIKTYDIKYSKAYIFTAKDVKKFSNSFVKNFPEIFPEADIEKQDYTSLYRRSFNSDEYFLILVRKLINNNYIVKDEFNEIYTKENINEKEKILLSGEFDKKISQQEEQKIEFIKNEFGETYINKFLKLKEYFENNNIKFYLKKLNTLRTNKITINTTLPELFKDNHINIISEDSDIYKITLYKIFRIYEEEKLWSYKQSVSLDDCLNGYETGYFSYYESYTRYLDMNDLPVIFKSLKELYNLYYCIGKACLEMNNADLKNITYSQLNDFADKKINVNISVNNFNFNYLTEQFKFIIDKQCKKYKIK